jgi:mono/diheme cytochrome c family protein
MMMSISRVKPMARPNSTEDQQFGQPLPRWNSCQHLSLSFQFPFSLSVLFLDFIVDYTNPGMSSPQVFELCEGDICGDNPRLQKRKKCLAECVSVAQVSKNFMKSRNSAANCSRALIVLAVFLVSGLLLAQSVSDWRAPASAANRPNPLAGNANAIALGEKLYVSNCLTCHGPNGKGDGPGAAALEKKPADLGARIRATGEKDGELFWKISEGRAPMVTWKTSLSETQRWELVNYIRTTFAK